MLAALQHHHECALVGIGVLGRLVELTLALFLLCPGRADELEMQRERPHRAAALAYTARLRSFFRALEVAFVLTLRDERYRRSRAAASFWEDDTRRPYPPARRLDQPDHAEKGRKAIRAAGASRRKRWTRTASPILPAAARNQRDPAPACACMGIAASSKASQNR